MGKGMMGWPGVVCVVGGVLFATAADSGARLLRKWKMAWHSDLEALGERVERAHRGCLDRTGKAEQALLDVVRGLAPISDLDRLKSFIALNNGKVDAVLGPNGSIDGQMSVDTRYLILCDHTDEPRQDQERRWGDQMSEEADTLGIEPITLHDFLQLMGWQSERRTVKLGIGAESKDFTATKEDVTTLKRTRRTDSLRPRKPQPPY